MQHVSTSENLAPLVAVALDNTSVPGRISLPVQIVARYSASVLETVHLRMIPVESLSPTAGSTIQYVCTALAYGAGVGREVARAVEGDSKIYVASARYGGSSMS
eukprot:2741876-Rhodomonas_salina.1